MTPEEIVKVLREVEADAKASEGDYYADQYAWHGAGEIADAVERMAAEIARLRGALNVVGECLAEMRTRLEKHLLPLPPGPEGEEVGRE
jgi:hypothetical protein